MINKVWLLHLHQSSLSLSAMSFGKECSPAQSQPEPLRLTSEERAHVTPTAMSLVGGKAIPAERFRVTLRDAAASVVHAPEPDLRGGMSLLRGEAIPAHRFCMVLGNHPFAASVHGPEAELGTGDPGLCPLPKLIHEWRLGSNHRAPCRHQTHRDEQKCDAAEIRSHRV